MSAATPIRPPRPCPVCRKPADPAYRPFCSKRCSDIDLHRWLTDRYKIETDEPPEPDESERG
ncbi:DNA gyrase inhibitor YacG [Desertibaculum subflavum]|uniref:DNA gyrase inhibitor YacG n=1 Tax=Desertibaculum subflavum TaxID=2268458 RepID=UPI000E675A45